MDVAADREVRGPRTAGPRSNRGGSGADLVGVSLGGWSLGVKSWLYASVMCCLVCLGATPKPEPSLEMQDGPEKGEAIEAGMHEPPQARDLEEYSSEEAKVTPPPPVTFPLDAPSDSPDNAWETTGEEGLLDSLSDLAKHEFENEFVDDQVEEDPDLSLRDFEILINLAIDQRKSGSYFMAKKTLSSIIARGAPETINKRALLEFAVIAYEQGRLPRAIQVLSQYVNRYPDDPHILEILLKQGLLYRELGAPRMALSKFFAVMTVSLNLKSDHQAYYQDLVLRAQTEVAQTYGQTGESFLAAKYLREILKLDDETLDRERVHLTLVRTQNDMEDHEGLIVEGKAFLDAYPESEAVSEVHFLLASSLRALGQHREATNQVMKLLELQHQRSEDDPPGWHYWQLRAGNDIANQLYQDQDYLGALEVYLALARLETSDHWRFPVLYQIGLTYEKLEQPKKALEVYSDILESGKVAAVERGDSSFRQQTLLELTQWRKEYLEWLQEVDQSRRRFTARLPGDPTDPMSYE